MPVSGGQPEPAGTSDSAHLELERERATLLRLHAQERQAHFATDVAPLLAHDDDAPLYVRDGTVRRVSRDEQVRFTESFQGATYHEWDDLEPPIVRVADDGSLGWVISRVKVRRTKRSPEQGSDEAVGELRFVYAGIATYERRDGQWVRTANVATFQAPSSAVS